MKYTCTIELSLPVEQAAALWNNPEYFKEWQDGFISIELLSGELDQVGARSRILLKQGKGQMELIETILVNDLPKEKKGLYEHIHMTNTQTTRFEAINESHTRLISTVEYTQFNGFLPKLMSWLFPGLFKKQSQKWLNQFKSFAEGVAQ